MFGDRQLDVHHAFQCYYTHTAMGGGGDCEPSDFDVSNTNGTPAATTVEDQRALAQAISKRG